MTESSRRQPVILLVGTEDSRDILDDEFNSRYARDYDVRAVIGPGDLTRTLEALAAANSPIAWAGVDHELPGSLDLIDEIRASSPSCRRVVLVPARTFQRALNELRPALAVGRIDTYLLIPQGPRDEEFHTAIAEYLSEWATSTSTPEVAGVRIVDDGGPALRRRDP